MSFQQTFWVNLLKCHLLYPRWNRVFDRVSLLAVSNVVFLKMTKIYFIKLKERDDLSRENIKVLFVVFINQKYSGSLFNVIKTNKQEPLAYLDLESTHSDAPYEIPNLIIQFHSQWNYYRVHQALCEWDVYTSVTFVYLLEFRQFLTYLVI